MSGLLRRIRRPGAAEENRTEPIALPSRPTIRRPHRPRRSSPRPPSARMGRPCPPASLPRILERRAGAGRRGKMRRRARFLRRARELALRDLGGLVYEAHAREQDGGALVKEKVQHLAVLDEELRGLETALGTPRGDTVLREPGVGGTCPRCGELHASDARFCSACGLDLTAAAASRSPRGRPRRPSAARRPTGGGRAAAERPPRPTARGAVRRDGGARRGRPSRPSSRPPRLPPRPPRPPTAARRRAPSRPRPRPPSPPHDRGRDSPARHRAGVPAMRRRARARPGVVPELRDRGPHADRADAALARPDRARGHAARADRGRADPRAGRALGRPAAGREGAERDADRDPRRRARRRRRHRGPVVGETPTPAPTAVPSVTPTPGTTPDAGATPDPTQTTPPDQAETTPDAASTTGDLAEWPADKSGVDRRAGLDHVPLRGREEGARRGRRRGRRAPVGRLLFAAQGLLGRLLRPVRLAQAPRRPRPRTPAAAPTRAASSRAEPRPAGPPRRQPPRRRLGERVQRDGVRPAGGESATSTGISAPTESVSASSE